VEAPQAAVTASAMMAVVEIAREQDERIGLSRDALADNATCTATA